MSDETKPRGIHAAIRAAMDDIARQGIYKDRNASLGGASVQYRGIEAAMNQMSGVLIRHHISVTPAYSDLSVQERAKGDPKDGKATRFATLRGRFRFEADDRSFVDCECYGEAMDSGDKAVTKAQSVAFRTALFQTFVIPTMAIDPEEGGDGEEPSQEILSNDDMATGLHAIQSAATIAELQDAWRTAVGQAQAAKDATAYQAFNAAKDKRKKELAP